MSRSGSLRALACAALVGVVLTLLLTLAPAVHPPATPISGSTVGGPPDFTASGLAHVPPAPGPLLWSDPLGVDVAPLNGIACPSRRLCVAIDRAGGVVWTTDPEGPGSAWHRIDVDRPHELTGIACPSIRLCVAVDSGGDVVSTTDPTAGAGAWSVASVDHNVISKDVDSGGPVRLRGIACPSGALCVAVDAVGDAFTSTDPAGGARAWSRAHVDTARTRGCSGGRQACQLPIVGVSCPSTNLCAAVDSGGDILTTTSPTADRPWTLSAASRRIGSLYGVSCPTARLCLAPDGPRQTVVAFHPTPVTVVAAHPLSDGVYGIWCPRAGLCLASADTPGGTTALLGTTDPAARRPSWSVGPPGGVNGIACPSPSVCVAADGEGNVSAGVLQSALASSLRSDLLSAHHPPRQALAHAGSESLRFTSPITAQIELTWSAKPTGGTRPQRLATATYRFTRPRRATLHLRLSAAGRRALRSPARLTVTATATFATSTGSLTRSRRLVFAPRR